MKKIICLILAICMLISGIVVVYAEEPVEGASVVPIEDTPYYREVGVLSALGIMQGKSETDFGADDFLTRAEMSAIAIRFLGLEAENTEGADSGFTDVDAEHWGRYYIDMAAALGIINGNGDGTFEPEGETTAEQAIKIIVSALGYTPKAETDGGYPSGYITVANQLGLLKGIKFANGYNSPIARWETAVLVYNALEVDLMEVKSYGDKQESAISRDTTALSEYHDTVKNEGTVVTAYEGSLTDKTYWEPGRVIIDETEYETELDIGKYIGYNVDFYHTIPKGSEKSRVIAYFPDFKEADVTRVEFDDIAAVRRYRPWSIGRYYEESGKKAKRIGSSNPIIMYNGKVEKFADTETAQKFLEENMIRTLVFLKNPYSKYGDVLFIENYDAYVVSKTEPESGQSYYSEYNINNLEVKTLDLSGRDNPNSVHISTEKTEQKLRLATLPQTM